MFQIPLQVLEVYNAPTRLTAAELSSRFMKNFVPLDPDTGVSERHWATVYVPRRSRNRFAASCVTLFDSESEALSSANPSQRQFAAQVIGPSKSSEGQSLYYLVRWLGQRP